MENPEALEADGTEAGAPGVETPPAAALSPDNKKETPEAARDRFAARVVALEADYQNLYRFIFERMHCLPNDDAITLRRTFEPR